MDFGFEQSSTEDVISTSTTQQTVTSRAADSIVPIDDDSQLDSNGNLLTNIDDATENEAKKDNNASPKNKGEQTNDKNDNVQDNENATEETKLETGSIIEVGDATYTVNEKGDLVDKDGKVFKEAKDVDAWMKQFDIKEDNDAKDISIETVQDAIGIEITDDNDKPIEFDNSPEGIAAYVNAVIETSRDEHMEAALNTLYQKYPVLQDVLNYYVANSNSLDGFGEIPDRSNITIDDTNEAQQEHIIRTAWDEQGRKGDVNAYIQYLKSSGTLLAVAKEELEGLQEADRQYRQELEKEAAEKEAAKIQQLEEYWTGVKKVVDSRKIAGYTIPENIIVNKNGEKFTVTPNDFFNYIYRVDNEGKSAYERDLAKENPESRRDDELLRAYLKFVGGSYSNLIDMAVNDDKVSKLKLTAKERNRSSIKVSKPKTTKSKGLNTDFGY